MSSWFVALLAGAGAGVLSGFGVGGGTLLLVYMTVFAQVEQRAAQGINLLFFLPCALLALPAHFKNGFVEKKALLPAISFGLLGIAVGAWSALHMEVELLHRCFGLFLVVIGISELFGKRKK